MGGYTKGPRHMVLQRLGERVFGLSYHFILFLSSVLHDTKAVGLSAVVLSFQVLD